LLLTGPNLEAFGDVAGTATTKIAGLGTYSAVDPDASPTLQTSRTWTDPDGVDDGKNELAKQGASSTDQTVTATNRLRVHLSSNADAYNDLYTVRFKAELDVSALSGGTAFYATAAVALEYSTDGATYFDTGIERTVVATIEDFGSVITEEFTVVATVTGAPANVYFRFRLRLVGSWTGKGVTLDTYYGRVYGYASSWTGGSGGYNVDRYTLSGIAHNRRGLYLPKVTASSVEQPHAWFEPHAALPGPGVRGEIIVVSTGVSNCTLYICTTSHATAATWTAVGGSGLTGGGNADKLTRWSSTTNLTNARITDTGSGAISTDSAVAFTSSGLLTASNGFTVTTGTITLPAASVTWASVSKTGSSLADLATRSAGDLTSGNLAYARMPSGVGTWAPAGKVTLTSDWRLESTAPSFEIRESDQSLPNGLWRVLATGAELRIERNTHASVDFSTVAAALTFNSAGNITAGVWNATSIGAIYGGTAQTAVATGDVLYGSATNAWSRLTHPGAARYLKASGASTLAWAQLDAADVTAGNLAYARMPSGSGSWDTGSAGVTTVSRTLKSSTYAGGNSGTSMTVNWDNGQQQEWTLNNNVTINAPSGASDGAWYVLVLRHDGTAQRNITWNAVFKGASLPATGPNATGLAHVLTFRYRSTSGNFLLLGVALSQTD
jgi:hypothetical protein